MLIGTKDTEKEVFIIAEIGNNHEGDFERAQTMIEAAASAGADAVKFQTIEPDKLVSAQDTRRIEVLTKFQFSQEQFEKLAECAKGHRVMFLSTPFSLEAVDFLDDLVPAFKIASGDNNFIQLIERVAQKGKPIIMSSGLAEHQHMKEMASVIKQTWKSAGTKENQLAFLHCVSSYPTPDDQANLSCIPKLADLCDVVGYSDHTLGIEACILSVALGARIIEKHFTLDKNLSDFRDHQLSADPEDLQQLVAGVRKAEKLVNFSSSEVSQCETEGITGSRRSISAAKELPAGHILELADFTWVRPGSGLPPGQEELLLGKKLTRDFLQGEAIQVSDVQ